MRQGQINSGQLWHKWSIPIIGDWTVLPSDKFASNVICFKLMVSEQIVMYHLQHVNRIHGHFRLGEKFRQF